MFRRVEGASEPLTLLGCRKPDKFHAVSFFMRFSFDMFVEFLGTVTI